MESGNTIRAKIQGHANLPYEPNEPHVGVIVTPTANESRYSNMREKR